VGSVLIITYCYPPARFVASQRPFALAEQLVKHGYKVSVVTRDWGPNGDVAYLGKSVNATEFVEYQDSIKVIRSSFRGIYTYGHGNNNHLVLSNAFNALTALARRVAIALTLYTKFLLPVGPFVNLYYSARRELNSGGSNYCAIVAHGEPFVLFHYASRLSKEYGIPWVADFRDPWSGDHLTKMPRLSRWLLGRIEKRTVSNAALIVCATKYVQRNIVFSDKSKVILNGFSFPFNPHIDQQTTKGQFRIAIAGTLQPWDRWKDVIEALDTAAKLFNSIPYSISFIGTNKNEEILKFTQSRNFDVQVDVLDKIPHEDVVYILSNSDALLLFNSYAAIGTKVYEYLGLKKYIIFCFNSDKSYDQDRRTYPQCDAMDGIEIDCQQQLIEKHSGGSIVDDKEHLIELLVSLGNQKLRGGIETKTTRIDELTRETQMEVFCSYIDLLASSNL
jgi:hypothetical protein